MYSKSKLEGMISKLDDELLWLSFGLVKRELKKRGLARSRNITGEKGEKLALDIYNSDPKLPKLVAAPEGTRNIDALSRNGERYSIKTVTFPSTKKTGVFYGLEPPGSNIINTQLFEYVIVVRINDLLEPIQILELDWNLFLKHKKYDKRMQAWFLSLTKELEKAAKIIFEAKF